MSKSELTRKPASTALTPLQYHTACFYAANPGKGKTEAQRQAYLALGRPLPTDASLFVQATRTLRNVKVLALIRELQADAEEKLQAKIMRVVERKVRLSQIAMEDLRNEKGVPIREPCISAINALNRMERIGADPVTPGQVQLLVVHDSGDRLKQLAAIDGSTPVTINGEVQLLQSPELPSPPPDQKKT